MRREIRAKFRCMSVTHTWDKRTVVELSPVCQREDNKENEQFWKYTPSGEAKLVFKGLALDAQGKEYKAGDYYYIDMVNVCEEGGWTASRIAYDSKDHGTVKLRTRGGKWTSGPGKEGFSFGELSMGIDNPPAFKSFDPESLWDIQFRWAEASDG